MPTVVEVAAVVADNVHRDPADARVLEATAAAWRFVSLAEGLEQPADPPGFTVPDDPTVTQGLIGFARAVYLDAMASRGAQVAIGDVVVDTVYTPEDLYRHWRHYFAHLATSWGVA